MAEPKKYYPPLTVRVTPELDQALRDTADDRGETLSSYVRSVLVASTSDNKQQETPAA